MKSKTLTLTTRFNQNRPVTLAGLTFFSKRFNGEEEMTLQEIQLDSAIGDAAQVVNAEVDFVAELLRFRAVNDSEREKITRDFVLTNVGKFTSLKLLEYLRNGTGLTPGQTFDLPVFRDPADPEDTGTVTIEDRAFEARALSYAEALYAAEAASKVNALQLAKEAQGMIETADGLSRASSQLEAPAGADVADQLALAEELDQQALAKIVAEGKDMLSRAKEVTRASADVCAHFINARLVEGEPVTGAWLLEQVTDSDIGKIITYLTDGEYEEPDPEDFEGAEVNLTPKAEEPVRA